jgi:hypothetical protein
MSEQTYTDTGTTGAKRQSWKRANPRDVLKRIIDDHPEMSLADLQDECWGVLHHDEQLMQTVFEYWFTNNYRSLIKRAPSPIIEPPSWSPPETEPPETEPSEPPLGATEPPAWSPAATHRLAKAIRTKIDEKVEGIAIALLTMTMPNGKPFRQATREELLQAGGWMQRVADRLEPEQTVEQAGLSETQLRELYEAGQAAPRLDS